MRLTPLLLAVCITFFLINGSRAVATPLITIQADSSSFFYKELLKPDDQTNLKKAFAFYQNQYENNLTKKEFYKAANDLEIIATGKFNVGSFNESEQLLIQALNLYDKEASANSQKARKRIYNRLGIIYRKLRAYQKSLILYRRGLAHAENKYDSLRILNNVANVYREKGTYASAVDTLQYALQLAKLLPDTKVRAIVLDNLGFSQLKIQDTNALYNLNQSLKIRLENKDPSGLFSSYRHLSMYYKNKGDDTKSYAFAQKALAQAKKIKDPNYEYEALGLLAHSSTSAEMQRFKTLQDSLKRAEQDQNNRYAALKYDVEKEKEQTQIAKLQREKEKQKKLLFLFLAIVVSLSAIFIITYILAQRKKKQLKTVFETESRISKKLHDELANDTFQVMARLQTILTIPKDLIDELDHIYAKTRDISKDHNPLFEEANFYEELSRMLASYKTAHFNVMIRTDPNINWDALSLEKKKTIFIVLKELMTNNRKHSHSNFALFIFKQEGKKINIQYKDDGVGGNLSKNNGLQNVESRIDALNGSLTFDAQPNKGFQANVTI